MYPNWSFSLSLTLRRQILFMWQREVKNPNRRKCRSGEHVALATAPIGVAKPPALTRLILETQ